MARNLYFNADAFSPRGSMIKSNVDASPPPTFECVYGENIPVNLYLYSVNNGGYDSRSGNASYTVKVGVGDPSAVPSAGTFKLNWNGHDTAAIDYNATAQNIQDALNVASIGNGNLLVRGSMPVFVVEFAGIYSGIAQTLINPVPSVDQTALFPASVLSIQEMRAGDIGSGGNINELQSIEIKLQPVVLQTTWATITNGWTGTLNFNSEELLASFPANSTQITRTLEVAIYDASANRTVIGYTSIVINLHVIDENAMSSVSMSNIVRGVAPIGNGVEFKTITGLGLATSPTMVQAWIEKPTGGLNLFASVDYSTITSGGFTAWFNGMTDNANYKLGYVCFF